MGAKPLVVLFIFVLLLSLFASASIGENDLTPDTPPSQAGGQSGNQVTGPIAISGSGLCSSPYTVQKGDTLSAIARTCGISVVDILAVNPAITNPNLIHPNQQINIPAAQVVVAVQPTAVPVQAAAPTTVPTAAPVQPTAAQNTAPPSNDVDDVFKYAAATSETTRPTKTPKPGVQPGSEVDVVVTGLPPNTEVTYGLGRVGRMPKQLGEAITDANGSLTIKIKIPITVWNGQKWTVTVVSKADPSIKVTATPLEVSW